MSKTGVIGGSAVYELEDLEIIEKRKVSTPFGEPSDEFIIGKFEGKDVVFLTRHHRSHSLLPTEINFRANIYAFKVLGVERVISVSAVGSLTADKSPMDMVLVDQFIDRTNQGRSTTFFGDGIVAHVSFADPVCSDLKETIYNANKDSGIKMHYGGTYINMEGPAFSTRAESFLYKSWGADVIGMTNLQEARLAREAGMCYVTLAMVTDYDCWHDSSEVDSVSVELILEYLAKNADNAKTILKNTLRALPEGTECQCKNALRTAIITKKEAIPVDVLEKLKPILEGFI